MTIIVTTSSTTAATNITLANNGDLFVGPNAVRVSSGATGISAGFAAHAIDILGTVYGEFAGIALGAGLAAQTSSTITLGAAASVTSRVVGLRSQGATINIFNDGLIKGGTGIDHDGTGFFRLVNTGNIVGTIGNAIEVEGDRGDITNHGVIAALDGYGVSLTNMGSTLSSMTIRNFGTISGNNGAIAGADEVADFVFNYGTMIGSVVLRGGDDYYDGHDGHVTREIVGGEGNDTVIGGPGRDFAQGDEGNDSIEGGAYDDILSGGPGNDTLDGGAGDDWLRPGAGADLLDGGDGQRDLLDYLLESLAVTIDLATGDASGAAARDVFSGIERVRGGAGNDTLTGDAQANVLQGSSGADLLAGAGGNDVLSGGLGADTLLGGLGVDQLWGGTSGDVFRFATLSESGAGGQPRDRIVDFTRGEPDRIDLSLIDADATLAGNQAFVFNGAAAFTAAGQVRTQLIGNNTFVFANTDAVLGTAEFSVVLTGTVALLATDFIL